jgi:hypothetical protein
MSQNEINQRRAAAFTDLSEWFDVSPSDLRAASIDGRLVVLLRIVGERARIAARSVLGQHFPGALVQFD